MNVAVIDRQPDTSSQTKLGIVDCDVHPYIKSAADLDEFLPERWRERPKPGSLGTVMFAGGPHFCLGYHLAIPEGTVRSRLRRAKEALAAKMSSLAHSPELLKTTLSDLEKWVRSLRAQIDGS